MTDHRAPAAPPRATPSRKRFALTGRSHAFDSRINAARGDLADVRLADRIFAPHYSAAVIRGVACRSPVRGTAEGAALSEVLPGETFELLELSGSHGWGVGGVDGVVGYVDADALTVPIDATHVVCVPNVPGMPMGSRIDAARAAGVSSHAIRPLDAPVDDFVTLAEALIGTPATKGGRSSEGVSCTGLVFLTLSLAGIAAPRFADLQAARLGHAVGDEAPMLRGDLIFFADHVAIVANADEAIHVDAEGRSVVRESIAAIVDGGAFGPAIVRRRLP